MTQEESMARVTKSKDIIIEMLWLAKYVKFSINL